MNYKLEKFWNLEYLGKYYAFEEWTINLKSFEIRIFVFLFLYHHLWTINLKSFEILKNYKCFQFLLNEL